MIIIQMHCSMQDNEVICRYSFIYKLYFYSKKLLYHLSGYSEIQSLQVNTRYSSLFLISIIMNWCLNKLKHWPMRFFFLIIICIFHFLGVFQSFAVVGTPTVVHLTGSPGKSIPTFFCHESVFCLPF